MNRAADRPCDSEQKTDLEAARAGNERAFERLVAPHLAALRSYLYRMVCDPADAEDLAQETLLTAHQKLATFAERSSFRTWLFAIGTRKCLDHLRRRRRWPREAQIEGEQVALQSPEVMQRIERAIADPEFVYDYRQHVAYCFSCVAQSLPPEESAALMLKEIFLFESSPAAKVMDLSESTFRHRLSAARKAMGERFEGLCALIGKQGVCYQCSALRDRCPTDRRGRDVAMLAPEDADRETKLTRRLAVVRDTGLAVDPVHAVLFRFMSDLWNDGQPDADAERLLR